MAADLSGGWDARIYRRPPERPEAATHLVLHARNFALPAERGDYGSGAVELMSAAHVLVVLLEFGAEAVDRPLFAPRGRPSPVPYAAFRPDGLQRATRACRRGPAVAGLPSRSWCAQCSVGRRVADASCTTITTGAAADAPAGG